MTDWRPGADTSDDVGLFECPVCGRSLRAAAGSLVCASGHSFDVAREGYVNLLPPQHRTRGISGDTASMLQARRRFLEAGHYRPLLELAAEKVADAFERAVVPPTDSPETASIPAERPCVLEVGCGEGAYIGGIATMLGEASEAPVFLGMDVSKDAARMAAKRYPEVTFFVADVNRRIYLTDASVDVVLDIFSPRNPIEFARVVRPHGRVLVVIPADTHLASLRAELGLLDIQEDKEAKVLERFGGTWRLSDRVTLRYDLTLAPAEVADVVAMGPNQWHRGAPMGGQGLGPVATEASFIALTLRPNW